MALARGRAVHRRRGAKFVFGALALVVCLGVVTVARAGNIQKLLVGATAHLIAKSVPDKFKNPAPQGPVATPITVLVMGTEAPLGYDGQNLTDSMMVVSYNPTTDTVSLLSIPRDLWVDIPGEGYQRINTAYENGGVARAELAVEQWVGVPVEYFAIVNYTSFTDLVNAVGCVEIDVPKTIHDPTYPAPNEKGYIDLTIPAGEQCMNGTTALEYIRERHDLPLGDLSREADQQQMLLALKGALLQPKNLLKLPTIVHDVFGLVQTNYPYADAVNIAEKVLNMPSSSLREAVPGDCPTSAEETQDPALCNAVTAWVTPGKADVLIPNEGDMHTLVHETFPYLMQDMAEASVQVYNGTDQSGLADYYTAVLQGMGVTTKTAADAPAALGGATATSTVVYVNSHLLHTPPIEAYILAQSLGAPVVSRALPGSAGIDIVLGASFPHWQVPTQPASLAGPGIG